MKGNWWINELGTHKEDGWVFCQKKRIYWDMFFKERNRFLFWNYNMVKENVTILTPSERRHNFDLKPKCITRSFSDHENFPIVLEIILSGKTSGKTEVEVKRGSYRIRKAQDHDYWYETLAEPSARNESVFQYHKLEKKHKDAETRMEELQDQLKKTTVKARRCKFRKQSIIYKSR